MAGEQNPVAAVVGHKAQLLDSLYNDPQYRKPLLEMIHSRHPDVRIPEIVARQEIHEATKPLTDHIEKLEGRLLERDLRDQEREIRSRHRIGNDEEWKSVQEFASAKGIANLDTAAEMHRLTSRAVEPRYAPTPIQLPNMKELWKNPVQYARDEAYKVLNEAAAAKARGY